MEELGEDLVEADLSRDDLRVLRAVEILTDVECSHVAVAFLVNLFPCSVNCCLSVGVRGSSDGLQECIKVYETIFLSVEVLKDGLSFALCEDHAVVLEGPVELLLIKFAHAVMDQNVFKVLG